MNNPGRPRRITKTSILKEADCISLLKVNSEKLPNSLESLNNLEESRDAYVMRKIRWAAEFLRAENLPVTYWNIIKNACVYNQRENPAVFNAIMQETSKSEK